MIDPRLEFRLRRVANKERQLAKLAGGAAVIALWALVAFGAILFQDKTGWSIPYLDVTIVLLCLVSSFAVLRRLEKKKPDWRRLAQRIEQTHPDLEGRLLTAVQLPDDWKLAGRYFRERLHEEVFLHNARKDWAGIIPSARLAWATTALFGALVLLGIVLLQVKPPSTQKARFSFAPEKGVTVEPGDASLERGSGLMVIARFTGESPAAAELVLKKPGGAPERVPLTRSFQDPIFGGGVAEVQTNFSYVVEYDGKRTREYQVEVFEYPKLEKTEAILVYPQYTGQPEKQISNARRFSAVEGTRLDLKLTFNKPIASAAFVPKEKAEVLNAAVETNAPTGALRDYQFGQGKTYELRLVDFQGRTNKSPDVFVFDALKNRAPEMKLAYPRGDIRPSPLEEIVFEGTAWDDYGVKSYGLTYQVAGAEPVVVELGGEIPAKVKKEFRHVLNLEDLGIGPDQLVAWFMWAEDLEGEAVLRRTQGDLFFAEVRPFEEVFREGASQEGSEGQQGEGQGSQSAKLAELQKQIMSATWNLHRAGTKTNASRKAPRTSMVPWNIRPGFLAAAGVRVIGQVSGRAESARRSGNAVAITNAQADAVVVRDAQAEALGQAEEASARQQDPRLAALWRAAITEMEKALEQLERAKDSPAAFEEALRAEQAAYQALLRLKEREYQVSRSRRQSQGQSGQQNQMQEQLDEMELTQSEDRYETRNQAQRPSNQERQEQLQIMNRLQELARRQQDLNERLRELQAELQAANDEQEREEIRRRLKRLQEEEQQMLADMDEVRQRMNRAENQSAMNQQREQLEQSRQEVQKAAEAAAEGSPDRALASGTRAQRQLQEMHDQMRRENSNEFAQDLRELRGQARQLAREQEQITKALEEESQSPQKSLSGGGDRQKLNESVAQQQSRMTNLVDRATTLSEQAESTEPVLSRQLHDAVREFVQSSSGDLKEMQQELLRNGRMTRSLYDRLTSENGSDASKLMDITSEMLRLDFLPEAQETANRSGQGIQQLRQGVEQAAENILGDDTEELKMARDELDRLMEELRNEMAQNGAAGGGTNASGQMGEKAAKPAEGRQSDPQQARDGNESRENGESQEPGSASQPGSRVAQGRGGSPNENNQPGSNPQQNDRANEAEPNEGANRSGGALANRNSQNRGGNRGGAEDLRFDLNRFLESQSVEENLDPGGPITGGGFVPWTDRLRDLEELMEMPEARSGLALARDRVRNLRRDYKRDQKRPDWNEVRLQVLEPLVEVRNLIAEELARRQSSDALVPIDRDPVPGKYSELVKRYYERLGKEQTP